MVDVGEVCVDRERIVRTKQTIKGGCCSARRSRLGRRAFFSRLGSHILPSHPRDVDDDVVSRLLSASCVVVPWLARSLAHVGLSNVSTLFFVSGGPLAGQVHGPPRFSGPNCRVQLFNYRVSGPGRGRPLPPPLSLPLHARSKCEYIHTRAHVDAFWSSPPTKREGREREREKDREEINPFLPMWNQVRDKSRRFISALKLSFDPVCIFYYPFHDFQGFSCKTRSW